ncbi:MAG: dynamin family protein [Nostocaceae cyanobacterium]|nr:dynamin family protein [Nostocaceae cyanobacterium]
MEQNNLGYKELTETFISAANLLDIDSNSSLHQDIRSICNYLKNPNFKIAVFGPFNHGKSTLINAMLGNKTLPIDLIPSTGAAITVKYGSDLRTRITLVDGSEIYRSGTDILKKYAILDGDRQMRADVASVEVFCPHPFLETGVEFLDLPGTNDREAQDNLVRQQLLGADVVVQLLDARKLMTLGEREHLRDWLLERGIKTVIFVVNFLNLLELEEQKEVQNRLRFVAESFRADLPPGFSNLYRVDALPALRGRLKGDVTAANTSGLVAFESALQNIVGILQKNHQGVRSPRVQAIASQVQQALIGKIAPLKNEIEALDDKNKAKNDIKQKAADLIQKGFDKSVADLRDWLALPHLRNKYQADAAVAIAQNNFKSWEGESLKKDLKNLQNDIVKWLYQAYDFFQAERPEDLSISIPQEPQVKLPPKPTIDDGISEPASLAVGGGIGWLFGGPLGAAVVGGISYLVNKNLQKQDTNISDESYHQQVARICVDAVDDYLSQLSNQGLSKLTEYEKQAATVIRFSVVPETLEISQKRQELEKWQTSLKQLNQELEKTLGITIPPEIKAQTEIPKTQTKKSIPRQQEVQTETPKTQTKQSVYRFQGKGVKEYVGTSRQQATHNKDVKEKSTEKSSATYSSSPSSPPPPNIKDLEAKFSSWEIEEEIAQMKANMGSPGFKTGKQQQTNQNQKTSQQPQKQVDKAQISRAYNILGLQVGASVADVKKAYKTLVKKWHPDLYVDKPQLQKQAQDKMRLVNEAYTILIKSNI